MNANLNKEQKMLLNGLSSFPIKDMNENIDQMAGRLTQHLNCTLMNNTYNLFIKQLINDFRNVRNFEAGETGTKIFNEIRFYLIRRFEMSYEQYFHSLYEKTETKSDPLILEINQEKIRNAM